MGLQFLVGATIVAYLDEEPIVIGQAEDEVQGPPDVQPEFALGLEAQGRVADIEVEAGIGQGEDLPQLQGPDDFRLRQRRTEWVALRQRQVFIVVGLEPDR